MTARSGVYEAFRAEDYLPPELQNLQDPQTAIPAIAKDRKLLRRIAEVVQQVPTCHAVCLGDARASFTITGVASAFLS